MIKGLLNNIGLYFMTIKLVLEALCMCSSESRMQVQYCYVDDELC